MNNLETKEDICISPEDITRELESESKIDYEAGFSKTIPFSQTPPFFQAPPIFISKNYSSNITTKYKILD